MSPISGKIRELVEQGDYAALLAAITGLRKKAARKERLLSQQTELVASLRSAFMETELDRDRLLRMSGALLELCRRSGLESDAREIVDQFGGLEDSHRRKTAR